MKKRDPSWAGSLKSYPRKEGRRLSPAEELIDLTVSEWYSEKHRKPTPAEASMVNSSPPPGCPYCGSADFVRDGKRKDGVQKYLCRSCGRRFNPLTGTVFDSHKIPISEWIEYLMHLFEFHSVVTSARDKRNAHTTGLYWIRKVFAVLDGCQDGVVLSGRVWLDETFVSVDKPKRVRKGGKGLRGISRNMIAIGVATDGKSLVVIPEWCSKPSRRKTAEAFSGHIADGSRLIHDGDNSHSLLIGRLGLSSEVHPTSETKGLADSENPLDEVNGIHAMLKRFLREHGGYSRDDLMGWCNLFWFIWSDPTNRMEKVSKFIEMAISTRERIKFRDVFGKKADE
jgi:transposase-like protein